MTFLILESWVNLQNPQLGNGLYTPNLEAILTLDTDQIFNETSVLAGIKYDFLFYYIMLNKILKYFFMRFFIIIWNSNWSVLVPQQNNMCVYINTKMHGIHETQNTQRNCDLIFSSESPLHTDGLCMNQFICHFILLLHF